MNPDHSYFTISLNPAHGSGELSLLFSGEGKPLPSHKIGPAVHDYYLVHTVLAGKGVFEMRGKRYDCQAGDTFFIFPGELFSYEADAREPWHYVWAAFVGHAAVTLLSAIGITPEQPVVPSSGTRKVRGLYRRMRSCFQQKTLAALEDVEAGAWLRLLIHEFGRINRERWSVQPSAESIIDRQIAQAIRFLSLQFTQPVSIEQMSRMLGYHRTHLCKIFKRTTGFSPMQYLLKIRMERACMLLGTAMTIDQVASSVGFNDALYFSKQFRKWNGLSPSEYRKKLRNDRA